jgi:hypothetical protein
MIKKKGVLLRSRLDLKNVIKTNPFTIAPIPDNIPFTMHARIKFKV